MIITALEQHFPDELKSALVSSKLAGLAFSLAKSHGKKVELIPFMPGRSDLVSIRGVK